MGERLSRRVTDVARLVIFAAIAAIGIAGLPGRASAQANPTIFLHGSGSTPPALFLDTIAPSAATPKFQDSAGVAFSGGNPWKVVGTWTAATGGLTGTVGNPIALSTYVGLRNTDDNLTAFDVRAELYKNGSLVGSGQTSCITGVTRNPDQAKNIVVSVALFLPTIFGAADVLSVMVSTRIGTTGTGAMCVGGHANATGLRLYFDGVTRPSQLAWPTSQSAAPTLIRAISTSATDAFLIGRVEGAPNATISVQALTAASCTNGALPGGGTPAGNGSTTTDANGYFGVSLSGISPDSFVAVRLTTPTLSAPSQCLASAADNDSWPKALDITSAARPILATSFIDEPGKTRWFKFKVAAGQRIQVTLSGLPADYDLAVFKDIGQLFDSTLLPANASALTKVSAEYAPSAFTPSAFTPSAFTPSAFTPSAFTPSAFTPSAFTPSAFTPSAFTPSAFTASAFSPSAFTPSAFTPSAFTPSAFTPSAFTPSAFTPSAFTGPGAFTVAEVLQAFSSAQTRSILGASATLGLGNESVVVNSWSNTGNFYVRVSSHGGAYSTASKFTVSVDQGVTSCTSVTDTAITPAASQTVSPGSFTTVILTDSSKVRLNASSTTLAGQALVDKLTTFAGRPDINGVVVDLASASYARVQALKTQAANNRACPVAMNLVAQEIKSIVDAYRLNSPVRYVVIAGNDAAVPFFRYPDESLLAPESGYVPPLDSNSASDASLRRDYVLSQDAYGSSVQLSLRSSTIPVPGLAVGRLVETAEDIGGLIDAYADANGSVVPRSSLVTGYDFLEDGANAVRDELCRGIGATTGPMDALITPKRVSPQGPKPGSGDPPPWTASDLGNALLGPRHDLIFLAGHFSANDALAADFTTNLLTTDLAASATDFKNSIVFSAGCHSGYNIVDADILQNVTQPLDWAQAFAAKQATLIAGTGYQYGDTDFIEYSERLYLNFAKQLRAGTSGPVAVGEALVKAKLQYLANTPDMRGIHHKAVLEATLFGLPMLGVNLPSSGRTTINAIAPAITPLPVATGTGGAPLGLMTKKLTYAPADPLLPDVTWVPAAPLQAQTATLDTVPPTTSYLATYLAGPDGVTSNPVEPVLPLVAINVTPTISTTVLRGVGFRGGSYVDTTPVLPLTGAPATEIRGMHLQFLAPQFFPMRMWTPNHFPALGGTVGTNLLVTPVQHRAADPVLGTTTRRVYTNLDLRLYYSGNLSQASLSDAPAIVSVDGQFDGSGVAFAVRVVGDPAAAMQEVWITYTSGNGTWSPLNLAQCVNGACPGINDSQLWKGRLPLAAPPVNFQYIVQAANGVGLVSYDDKLGGYYTVGTTTATTLALNAPPSSGVFGDIKPVTATLSSSAGPVSGKMVTIGIGGTTQIGVTDGSGNVTVNVPVQTLPGTYQLTAAFGGDSGFLPASMSAPFAVGQATAGLAWDPATATATLTGSLGGTTTPLLQEAVTYVVSGAGGSKTLVVNTDYAGRAPLPPTGLPVGSYTVAASFAGNATYSGTTNTVAQPLSIVAQTITFNGNDSLPDSITVGGAPVTFTVASSAGQPVTVGLAPPVPPPGPYCTLSSVGNDYTLTPVAPGTCTVVASAGGTTTSTSVNVTQDIAIKGDQIITFAALAAKTFGESAFNVSATGGASGNSVTFAASGNCTVTGTLVAILGAGSCTITASQAGSANYNAAADVPQSFAIARAGQIISFSAVSPAPTFVAGGTGTFTVSATAPGGTVTFSVPTTTAVCTVAGTTVTMKTAGLCTLLADQAGNANHLPAPSAMQSVQIGKASQTITFAGPGNQTLGVPANNQVALIATSTSGLPVSFAATPAGVCTVSGATLTMVAAGSCTITASRAEDGNFSAATPVVRTITISSSDLTNVWTKVTAPMTKKRFEHTATRFESGQPLAGQVLITGGYDRTGTAQLTAELYNPATRTFVATGSMPTKSAGHTATLLLDGKVVVFGGGNAKVQRFDPTTKTWSQLSTSMSSNRTWHTATRLPDGRVLVIGGYDSSGNTMSSTIVYDPTGSGSFTNGPTMDTPRKQHTATLLTSGPNAGKVLVVGGRKKSGSGYVTLATYQICGAAAPMGAITCTPSATGIAGRYAHAAVALGPTGSKVLIAGGTNGSSDLASAELYDSVTGTWAVSGTLGVLSPARSDLTLSELPNGRALAVGGSFNGMAKKDADAYTPPIAAMADMWTPRAGHTATPLRDAAGNITGILVTGGADDDADEDDALDSAEIYGTQ